MVGLDEFIEIHDNREIKKHNYTINLLNVT